MRGVESEVQERGGAIGKGEGTKNRGTEGVGSEEQGQREGRVRA